MSGLPIDINTNAAPTDNGGTRANRSRRDGGLRAPQFEQLLLALTAAKPLRCGTSDPSTSTSSTAAKSSVEFADGPAANPTRCVAPSDAEPSATVEDDAEESDVDVAATSDEKAEPDEQPLSPESVVDPSSQVVVCTFENHKPSARPDVPAEESAADVGAIDAAERERKSGLAKALATKASSTGPEPASDLPATASAEASPEVVVNESLSEVLDDAPPDSTAVAADRSRRTHRSRPNKAAADEQATTAEALANQASEGAAGSSDAGLKTASRGSKHEPLLFGEVQNGTEPRPELAPVADTQAVSQLADENATPSPPSLEPAANEGLKESRLAGTDEKAQSSGQVNVPAIAPPPAAPPTSVVPPTGALPTQQQVAQAANASGTANSKPDSTGGVTASPANRLPHRAIPTARSSGPAGSSQIDTVKFIQRIARAMQTAREAGGEIRLRLSPPELGSMKMEVKVQDGTLVAKVETETAQAQSTLVDNLPALKERLAEQGIRIERFDVDVSRDDRGQSGFADRENSSDRGSQPRSQRRDAFHRQVSDPAEAGSVPSPITTPQSINVVA